MMPMMPTGLRQPLLAAVVGAATLAALATVFVQALGQPPACATRGLRLLGIG